MMVSPPMWYALCWLGMLALYCSFWSHLYREPAWQIYGLLLVGAVCEGLTLAHAAGKL